jgi:hypothetical protein
LIFLSDFEAYINCNNTFCTDSLRRGQFVQHEFSPRGVWLLVILLLPLSLLFQLLFLVHHLVDQDDRHLHARATAHKGMACVYFLCLQFGCRHLTVGNLDGLCLLRRTADSHPENNWFFVFFFNSTLKMMIYFSIFFTYWYVVPRAKLTTLLL